MKAKGTILLDGLAVSGVNVFVSNAQGEPLRNPSQPGFIGTTTNSQGQFEIDGALMDQFITATFVGYQRATLPVNNFVSFSSVVNLQEATNTLPQFEVVGKKRNPAFAIVGGTIAFALLIFIGKKYIFN